MQIANKFIELLEETKSFLYNSLIPQYEFRDMHAKLYQILYQVLVLKYKCTCMATAGTELQIKNSSICIFIAPINELQRLEEYF